jgi:hypothetical protein
MNVQFPRPSSSPLHALQPAIRFRLLDSDIWLEGQVEDFSEQGLAFLSDLPFEIGTYLEIALPQTTVAAAPPCLYVRVSSRVLSRWPDLQAWIGTDFAAAPARHFRGAA